jgi:hypothetical protein
MRAIRSKSNRLCRRRRSREVIVRTRRSYVAVAVMLVCWGATALRSQGQGGGGQGGNFVAYPQRPSGDPAAIERGKALYGANCVF